MRNNVVKKVLAATLACMMTFSMTTVAQAKGDKKSDKEITIGVTSFADTLEPTEQYFSWVVSRYAIGECLTKDRSMSCRRMGEQRRWKNMDLQDP